MVSNAPLILQPLPLPFGAHPETAVATRRLTSAHASVQGLLTALHTIRHVKVQAGQRLRRLAENEVDLLRAAIVFAGAGMDTVLSQLTRDALPSLLIRHQGTRGPLTGYAVQQVQDAPGRVTGWLRAKSIDEAVRTSYVDQLVSGSLQATSQVRTVRDALGIDPASGLDDNAIDQLNDFFKARNEIAHELDLVHPTRPIDSSRRSR